MARVQPRETLQRRSRPQPVRPAGASPYPVVPAPWPRGSGGPVSRETLDSLEQLLQAETDRHDASRIENAMATPVNEQMYAWSGLRPRFDLDGSPGRYELLILPTALMALEMLPRRGQMQLARLIDRLASDTFPPEAEPLTALPEFFRMRAGGVRLLYGADGEAQSVLVVGLWPDRRPS